MTFETNTYVYDGAAWQKLSSVSLDSGTAYGIKAQLYGDYSGTPTKIAVNSSGYLISSPVVRTSQTSKTSITSLAANAAYNITSVFDALAYTRLIGSLESDRDFYFFLNQGEDSPITDTLKYQTVYYPSLSVLHPTGITFQVDSIILAGTCTGSGTITATVTALNMSNSPKVVTVNVLNNDTAAIMAAKVRAALSTDSDVASYFHVSGLGSQIVLKALYANPNDTTTNIALAVGTATNASFPQATSTHTTAGTAVKQVETATAAGTITGSGNATVIVTSANMTNSPKTISVAVTNTDTAATWAGKVRTALLADVDVQAAFDVSGSTTSIVLTAVDYLANDSTLNISLANGTCTGITAAPTSANTTAGVAGSIYKYICAFDQELIHRYAEAYVYIGSIVPQRFRYGLFATAVVR